MESEDTFTLSLSLDSRGGIEEGDLDELSRTLRSELEELPFVKSVELGRDVGGDLPAGSKSAADVVTVGSLLMAILPDAIPKLLECLSSWVSRPDAVPLTIKVQAGDRVVEAEFDPDTMSVETIEQLASNLLDAVQGQASSDPTA